MNPPQRFAESDPPRGLLRWIMRMPLWLYRTHFGWLLGDRFLMLTHTGRKSGLSHQTVVEVVHRYEASAVYVIASGWGPRADWYRNIQQTPQVTVQVGNSQFEADAERLAVDVAASELYTYAQAHSIAFRELSRVMIGRALSATKANCEDLARYIPLVALRPR